ncbi:MAG: tetratricopeptide repeat protein [Thermoplasmatota archaeon]
MLEEMEKVSFEPDLIGREQEISRLRDFLEEARKGNGSTVFISGEAGVGKTRLVEDLVSKVKETDIEIVKGWCLADNIEPLMPVREALREINLYHLISGAPPPKIISIYLMDYDGNVLEKAERKESNLDPAIFSKMLSSVQSFVKDSLDLMGEEGGGELSGITYDKYNIFVRSSEDFSLATVVEGTVNEVLIDDVTNTLRELENKTKKEEDTKFETVDIGWFIESGKYEGVHLVDDPKLKQENMFDNVVLGLQRLSEEDPIVFFIDDLQWADQTTLNLLHYLSRNVEDMRMLILGTYRPEDIVKGVSDKDNPLLDVLNNMSAEDLYEEIELDRLDKDSTRVIIDSLFDETQFDEDFIDRIHHETDGNPLFIVELLNLLIEEGHIADRDGYRLVKPLDEIHFPSKIYDVIVRRLDRLTSEQRDILTYASVIGEEFKSRVLEHSMGMKRIILLKKLNEIENTHNVINSSGSKYSFDHNKIREILYEDINLELREEYHKLIAETYEELYEGDKDEVIFELAKHCYRGGKLEKAFSYCKKAARKAEDNYANTQAIELYDDLLDILQKSVTIEDADSEKIEILQKKGDCLKRIGEWTRAKGSYKEALNISEKIEDYENIADSKVSLGSIYKREARYDKALALFKESSDIYEEIDDKRGLCEAVGRVGSIYTNKSEYDEAIKHFKEMMRIAKEIGDKKLISRFYGNMGSAYYGFGELNKALGYYEKKLEIKREIGNPLEIGYTLVNMASIYSRLQNYEKTIEFCNQAMDIVEKTGDKLMEQNALGKLGIAYAEQGNFSKGLEYYKKKISISEKMGDRRSVAYAANNIGELYRQKGDYQKALEYYQVDRDISKDLDDKKGYAITIGNIGNLYKLMGQFDSAIEFYDESITIAKHHKAKDIASYFMCSKADLYFRMGRVEEAKKLNIEAGNIAEKIGLGKALFDSRLLEAKIVAREDKKKGVKLLEDMLDRDQSDPNKAELLYELFKISDDEEYRDEAIDFYKMLYEKNPSKKYEDILDELKGS